MNLDGKTALITGGARIGAVVAEALAGRGARVALSYRSSENAARETAEAIEKAGAEVAIFKADLADPEACSKLVSEVSARLGGLDILVNMASTYVKRDWGEQGAGAWNEDLNANARSAYLLSIYAAEVMKKSGAGRIINFGDWIAASGRPRYKGYTTYYTAKAAVRGLTEALALELAPEILVNCIAPGPILPPDELSEAEKNDVAVATPLGRWGGADEIAKTVLFLIESDFVTGETIRVDGGRHLA